jgi:hypothetical protein
VSDTNSWSATLQLEHAVGTVSNSVRGSTPMGCLRYSADPGSLVARSLNTLHSWQNLQLLLHLFLPARLPACRGGLDPRLLAELCEGLTVSSNTTLRHLSLAGCQVRRQQQTVPGSLVNRTQTGV